MDKIWENLPRELLTNIFKYLPPQYIKTPIIKYVQKKDLHTMLSKTTFLDSISNPTVGHLLKDKINWTYISIYEKLSENFIREFKDKINWWIISRGQILSEDFIR